MGCIIHGVSKSQSWLSDFHFQFSIIYFSVGGYPSGFRFFAISNTVPMLPSENYSGICPPKWKCWVIKYEHCLISLVWSPKFYSCVPFSLEKLLMAQWWRIHLQCRRHGRRGLDPWVGKIPWRRESLPTPVFWPGEFHGLYSPWDRKESDMTERLSLSLHFRCHHDEHNRAATVELFVVPSLIGQQVDFAVPWLSCFFLCWGLYLSWVSGFSHNLGSPKYHLRSDNWGITLLKPYVWLRHF